MDNNIITASITAGIVAILGAVYKLCHHCKYRSSCCGSEVKIDSNLSPPSNKESFDISKKEVIAV